MVGLRQLRLNSQLLRYLREDRTADEQPQIHSPSPLSYHRHRRWWIRNRLSEDDMAQIVGSFKAGTAKHVHAERYDINLRSLKKLLREEGVKRWSWNDIQT